jgi:hypothetical protein
MQYAISYVLGTVTYVVVVRAPDRDDAYDAAREWLRSVGLASAAIQGTARPAGQDDIDAWEANPRHAGGSR